MLILICIFQSNIKSFPLISNFFYIFIIVGCDEVRESHEEVMDHSIPEIGEMLDHSTPAIDTGGNEDVLEQSGLVLQQSDEGLELSEEDVEQSGEVLEQSLDLLEFPKLGKSVICL